jgi:hypothetical protein
MRVGNRWNGGRARRFEKGNFFLQRFFSCICAAAYCVQKHKARQFCSLDCQIIHPVSPEYNSKELLSPVSGMLFNSQLLGWEKPWLVLFTDFCVINTWNDSLFQALMWCKLAHKIPENVIIISYKSVQAGSRMLLLTNRCQCEDSCLERLQVVLEALHLEWSRHKKNMGVHRMPKGVHRYHALFQRWIEFDTSRLSHRGRLRLSYHFLFPDIWNRKWFLKGRRSYMGHRHLSLPKITILISATVLILLTRTLVVIHQQSLWLLDSEYDRDKTLPR